MDDVRINRAISFGRIENYENAILDLDIVLNKNSNHAQCLYLREISKIKIGKNGCHDLYKAHKMHYPNAYNALMTFCK